MEISLPTEESLSLTDLLNRTTAYTYDANGRVATQTQADTTTGESTSRR